MSEYPFLGYSQPLAEQKLPEFTMYSWNFDKNSFEYDGDGHLVVLRGNDALKAWIIKALRTERFKYLAYSKQYGSEIYSFMAKVMQVGERKSELKRAIIECLMVNPYIVSIDSVEFVEAQSGNDLTINITLTTTYGRLSV